MTEIKEGSWLWAMDKLRQGYAIRHNRLFTNPDWNLKVYKGGVGYYEGNKCTLEQINLFGYTEGMTGWSIYEPDSTSSEAWLHKNEVAEELVATGLRQAAAGQFSDSPPDLDVDEEELKTVCDFKWATRMAKFGYRLTLPKTDKEWYFKNGEWWVHYFDSCLKDARSTLLRDESTSSFKDVTDWEICGYDSPRREIVNELLKLDIKKDWSRLRELILDVEDLQFTPEQSLQLAPRLLDIAIKHRDSTDPKDVSVVLSAIRTGASMYYPNKVNHLPLLLEQGHSIETTLVALKMLGRIFEICCPRGLDQYQNITDKIELIVNNELSLLSDNRVINSQNVAILQLAIFVLAITGSNKIFRIIDSISSIGVLFPWFSQQIIRELQDLKNLWKTNNMVISSDHKRLFDDVINELDIGKIKEKEILNEIWREYVSLQHNKIYRIENPVKLFLCKGGTTNWVLDAKGNIHCVPGPESGWIVRWAPNDHDKPVAFKT